MARVEKTVFISYRRKDISWALAVYQYLTSRKYDVFFDYTSLSGGDFEQVIVSNIKARAHFVLILTPTALDRCHEPGDWLTREIETAVDEKRNIIPLFFDGFNFSSPSVSEKLTGKIAAINRYNGLDVPAGYFLEAMERLRNKYLNIPLEAVIHPVSSEVQRVVLEEQVAADRALVRKSEDIQELVKPVDGNLIGSGQVETATPSSYFSSRRAGNVSQRNKLRLFGIGAGVLLAVATGIAGIRTLMSQGGGNTGIPTGTSPLITQAIPVEPSVDSLGENPAVESPVPITTVAVATEEPFLTAIPSEDLGGTRISSKDGATLISMAPGTFTMGLTDEQTNTLRQLCNTPVCEELYQVSQPAHQVELTKRYWIYQTEVSNAQYAMCVDSGSCSPPRSFSSVGQSNYYDSPAFADYPVVWMDWDRAAAYCKWAGGRLPTSAEWEYAGRGNDGRLFPWGNDIRDGSQANVNGFPGAATAVNSFADHPSPFGLLNMTGNVWEWVSDWYSPTYYSENTDWTDPQGPPDGSLKIGRGGSWWIQSALASIAIQDWEVPSSVDINYSYDGVGFRCVIEAP